MNTETLESLGLTKNQAEVYISLLKLGSTSAQNIIKESGMHRSRVYDSLEKLQGKGVVSSVLKDFKRYFQAAPPTQLFTLIEEKKEALKKELPKLRALEGMKKEEINASIFKGKEGLKTIHNEMLKQKGNIKVLGAKGLIYSELEFFTPHFERDRVKKGLKWKILWDKEETASKISKKKLVEGKVLPKGFDSNGVVNIFGDKVAIVLWKEKYPTGFMIDNKDIANSFRKWFDLIYDKV